MRHYNYEYNADTHELTVTWYDGENNEIISGYKLVGNHANIPVVARAFAEDLYLNNIDLFPEEEPDVEDITEE
jgi:hypothetical protein